MKHIDLEHIITFMIGSHPEKFIVTAKCIATDTIDLYKIRIVVKSKDRNRRKIHNGEIELNNPRTAIEDVKEYMDCGDVVQNMIKTLSVTILNDFPEFYPSV